MADLKISDLPAAGSANTSMELEANDSGTSRKVTVAQIMALVQAAIAAYVAAQDVEVFKGSIDCSANPNFPAADAGHVYRVSVAGKIGGASGIKVEAGDRLECFVDSTASGTAAAVGANWMITQTNVDGAVTLDGVQTLLNKTLASPTTTGKLLTAASATGGAGLNLPAGAAPTSPVDGDVWTTTAGFFVRIAGVTIGPIGAGGSFASITSAASPYAASAGRRIHCTSGAITVNLPASPAAGDEVVVIRDGAGDVTVGRNTKTISGASADFVVNLDKRVATFTYSGTTWVVAGGRIA